MNNEREIQRKREGFNKLVESVGKSISKAEALQSFLLSDECENTDSNMILQEFLSDVLFVLSQKREEIIQKQREQDIY